MQLFQILHVSLLGVMMIHSHCFDYYKKYNNGCLKQNRVSSSVSSLFVTKRREEEDCIASKKVLILNRGGGRSDYSLEEGEEEKDDRTSSSSGVIHDNNITSVSSSTTTTTTNNANTLKSKYILSIHSIQGKRQYMEDEYFTNQDGTFVGVFDGHGGKAISRYLRQNLYARYLQAKATITGSSISNHPNFINDRGKDQYSNYGKEGEEESEENENVDDTKKILNHKLSSSSSSSSSSYNLNETKPIKDETSYHNKNDISVNDTIKGYILALTSAFKTIDEEVTKISHWSYQGSTAVAVLLCHIATSSPSSTVMTTNTDTTNIDSERKDKTILISANVGDSRAVLCRCGDAIDLTIDHKPNHPAERERIEKLGGKVKWCGPVHPKTGEPIHHRSMSISSNSSNNNMKYSNKGGSVRETTRRVAGVYRINGNLALSRAIGDRSERPLISSEVEIRQLELDHDCDEFIILASDGLWVSFINNSDSQIRVNYHQILK